MGYTPSSGSETYNHVPMVTQTGNGRNGTLNMTITNGVAVAATVVNGGSGYAIGDIVTYKEKHWKATSNIFYSVVGGYLGDGGDEEEHIQHLSSGLLMQKYDLENDFTVDISNFTDDKKIGTAKMVPAVLVDIPVR